MVKQINAMTTPSYIYQLMRPLFTSFSVPLFLKVTSKGEGGREFGQAEVPDPEGARS